MSRSLKTPLSLLDLLRRCRPEDTEDTEDRDASLSRFDSLCCPLRKLLERGELDVSGGASPPGRCRSSAAL